MTIYAQHLTPSSYKNVDSPCISVVLTVYNSARYLREAIDSILSQTFTDFEFVIVDDASCDSSREIIESYRDSRIVFIKNDHNLGQTKSLNIGIQRSRGKYVARMDADDISESNRLALQYDYLQTHPEIAVVGSWGRHISAESKNLRIFKVPVDPVEIKCYLTGCGDLSYWSIIHPSVVMRREALLDVGLYNEEKGSVKGYPQDYELWRKLSPKYKFGNIPEPLLRYRVLNNSDSRFLDQFSYRYEITMRQIKNYVPSMNLRDQQVLARMLEFKPQLNEDDGRKVLSLFDLYYRESLKAEHDNVVVERLGQKMKLYYLPQLFVTNKGYAFKQYLKFFRDCPACLWDGKFYRKLGKTFLTYIQGC